MYYDFLKINNEYIEPYLNYTNRNTNKNIACINASEHNNNDKTPSMAYYNNANEDKKNTCYCFSCNKHFDIYDLIKADEPHIETNTQCIDYLQDLFNIDNLDSFSTTIKPTPIIETPIKEPKQYNFNNAIKKAHEDNSSKEITIKLLEKQRGLSQDIINKYQIIIAKSFIDILEDNKTLIPNNKMYAKQYRIILPYFDNENNIIYFTGELLNRSEPIGKKYRVKLENGNYKELNKYKKLSGDIETPIFNERYLNQEESKIIFITEGIYDALSIEDVGDNKAIAITGTMLTRLKKLISENITNNVCYVLMFDNDDTGQKASKEIEQFIKDLDILCFNGVEYLEEYKELRDYKDSNEMLLQDRKTFKKYIEKLTTKGNILIKNNLNANMEKYETYKTSNLLQTFITRTKRDTFKPISTGINSLDILTGGGLTRQSLCVVGGRSSTGKTTYIMQIIDNMIKSNKCIYFSLEMSTDQIISKLISKRGYQDKNYKLTSEEILKGYEYTETKEEQINEIIRDLEIDSNNLMIINPQKPTIENIMMTINDYVKDTGEKPLIVIDYLQLIQSEKVEDKAETIKRANKLLKQYAIDNDTIVFIITALSRGDKTDKRVNISSGRDTSDIEYSSDYFIGLNFTSWELGKTDTTEEEEKAKQPRQMTIKLLKNRLGNTGQANYNYYSAYNYFEEIDQTRQFEVIKRGKTF